jgi:predicted Zn finger-like uncharacterized protein
MVSDPLTVACYGRAANFSGAMLIVCPNCATSYMIDQAAVGPAGRTVRCVRCKATWFAGGPASEEKLTPDAEVYADMAANPSMQSAAEASMPAATPADGLGADPSQPMAEGDTAAPPVGSPGGDGALAAATSTAEEPVAIGDGPSLVPRIEQGSLTDAATGDVDTDEIENFAARRQRLQARRNEKRRTSRWTAVILILLACNVAILGARSEIVRHMPQTASLFAAIGLPVNLRHLKFENVRISRDVQDGVNMLIVQGAIASEASKPIEVPRLRFAARNAGGQEIYTWTALPDRSILGPGERMEFSNQLASPPKDAIDLMVRFFNAQDAAAAAAAAK